MNVAVKVLLLVIVSILFFAIRAVVRFLNKKSQGGAISMIKANPILAEEFANGIDIPYDRRPFTDEMFALLKRLLETKSAVGPYTILYAVAAGKDRMLIFTELSFEGQGLEVTGEASSVKEKAYHDFLVHFDSERAELTIRSTIYENPVGKFQKQEFLKHVLASSV